MHVVIVANAPNFEIAPYIGLIQQADTVIAADGGALALLQAGLVPNVVVGDLDSLDVESEAQLEQQGATLLRYAREKNETDFELALLLAVEQGATEIDVVGALGGRWDHTLANVWLLAHPMLGERPIRILADKQTLFLVRQHGTLVGRIGDTVSLLPLTPEVHGVSTVGLLYPLQQATLYAHQARGVSNVLVAEQGEITIQSGLLVVVLHNDGGAHQWNTRRPLSQKQAYE